MFELVHVVPVLQKEDDQATHVRPVDQKVRGESMTADDVIFTAGFRIRKNPGLALLADVTVRAFAFENVELNLSLESEVLKFETFNLIKHRKKEVRKEREREREREIGHRESQRNEKSRRV